MKRPIKLPQWINTIRGKKQGNYGYQDEKEADVNGLCDRMNFAVAEAYKMLRTKIDLILPRATLSKETDKPEKDHSATCKVIGITSALRGEGKSTTSINLAYTLAETGREVCLLEADMRLPSVGRWLSMKSSPGLSNLLTGQTTTEKTVQTYTSERGVKFSIITAGDIPPAPAELLASQTMREAIEIIRTGFDYVLVDLPPITAVTDALAVAGSLDGILLVVRQDYCDREALWNAAEQFALSDTKILGVVMNCSDGVAGKSPYYRKRRGGAAYGYGADNRPKGTADKASGHS